MDCPPDMAASFLRKWHEESIVLTLVLAGPRFTVTGGGTVADFDMAVGLEVAFLAVKSSGEVTAAPGGIAVSLERATFEYVEPREAPPEIREQSEAMFVCILKIKVPAGTEPDFVLTLTEMRQQPEHSDQT